MGMPLIIAKGNIFFPKNLSSGNSEKLTLKASSDCFGIEVCTANNTQRLPVMCEDGNGNVITAWIDYRKSSYYFEIYAQKLDQDGNVKWIKNGIKIHNSNIYFASLWEPNICSDGAGGAIISWLEEIESYFAIKTQRIDADGNLLWGNNGIFIANTSSIFGFPTHLCSDGSGGALLSWQDGGVNVRKVDPSGNYLWSYNDLPEGQRPTICSDGMGGAIIAWYEDEESENVYAQRFAANGSIMWGENGTVICNADLDQSYPEICSNEAGGAIITWYDQRGGATVYAQRVDNDGNSLWQSNGTIICESDQYLNGVKSDGENGLIFFYRKYLEEIPYFYGQKLDSNGNKVWGASGTKITTCSAPDEIFNTRICSDGEGGALFAWSLSKNWDIKDPLYNNSDIYVQKINVNGQAVWKENGLPVCVPATNDRSGSTSTVQICNDGAGGAIVSYEFIRARWDNFYHGLVPYLWDIHAKRISSGRDLQWNVEPDWIFFVIIGVIIGGIAIAVVITFVLIKRRK